MKVRRRLARLGALPLKNTVYALPWSEEAVEDFQWLLREIEAEGGEAMLWEGTPLDRLTREAIEIRLRSGSATEPRRPKRPPSVLRDRVWVTRRDVHVDRIASAWLIRRFIDPRASFKFVPATGYRPSKGELRFDMFEAEFTHEGDLCTFETLLRRFKLRDPALEVIGQAIHDIDCKDAKFRRPETARIQRLIREVVTAHATDGARIKQGATRLEALYRSLSRPRKRAGLPRKS